MFDQIDAAYFEMRAAEEREAAEHAEDEAVAARHIEMAISYERRRTALIEEKRTEALLIVPG